MEQNCCSGRVTQYIVGLRGSIFLHTNCGVRGSMHIENENRVFIGSQCHATLEQFFPINFLVKSVNKNRAAGLRIIILLVLYIALCYN